MPASVFSVIQRYSIVRKLVKSVFNGFVMDYEVMDCVWETQTEDDEFGSSSGEKKTIKCFKYGSSDFNIVNNKLNTKTNMTYCVAESGIKVNDRINNMVVTSVYPIVGFDGKIMYYVVNTKWGNIHGSY